MLRPVTGEWKPDERKVMEPDPEPQPSPGVGEEEEIDTEGSEGADGPPPAEELNSRIDRKNAFQFFFLKQH
jgi:hypothetical protein